jgi:predicted small lipoprotein YifL
VIGFRISILVLAIGLAAAGCGRRGALEPPPGAPEMTPKAAPATPGGALVDTPTTSLQRPGSSEGEPLNEDIVRPDRPFLLDFLL